MNNTQHTPGPWMIDGNLVYALHDHEGHMVNRFSAAICAYTAQGGTEEEAKANARLIAAAPDLLEALIELRDWYAKATGLPAAKANAAIAKATEKKGA